jgi:hypothetical protein
LLITSRMGLSQIGHHDPNSEDGALLQSGARHTRLWRFNVLRAWLSKRGLHASRCRKSDCQLALRKHAGAKARRGLAVWCIPRPGSTGRLLFEGAFVLAQPLDLSLQASGLRCFGSRGSIHEGSPTRKLDNEPTANLALLEREKMHSANSYPVLKSANSYDAEVY